MTKTQQRGRVVLGAYIILVFCIAAILIPAYRILQGSLYLTSHGVRLGLVGGLLTWLYRGSNSARWICIALFGLAGSKELVAMFDGGDWKVLAVWGIDVASYLSFTLVRIVSPAIREFLNYQRQASQIAEDGSRRESFPAVEAYSRAAA